MAMMRHAPNVLSLFRIAVVPFFILLLFGQTLLHGIGAVILFAVAAITDYFDGRIARKYKTDSRFGEFIDPLADKILVGGAFISFVLLPDFFVPFILVLVILAREIVVTIMRVAAMRTGSVMKTERSGKLKTAFQMGTILIVLLLLILKRAALAVSREPGISLLEGRDFWIRAFGRPGGLIVFYIPAVLVFVCAVLAVLSMAGYVRGNRGVLRSLFK